MRFEDLSGLTSLPVEPIGHRFRHEEILTVLPVIRGEGEPESLLVACSRELAIVTGDAVPDGNHWMTQWAPWDTVRLADTEGFTLESDAEVYWLTVLVGGLPFHARLEGPTGQRALRDFVVATQARWAAPAPSP